MAAVTAPNDQIVLAAGLRTQVRRAGSGDPLLVIHGEFGPPGWLDVHARLSERFDVIVPSLPGYGGTERPDWIMSVRDLAAWVTWFARDLGLDRPVKLIGCSMGGWIAAEIATIAPQFIDRILLSGPMGLKPRKGEIFDYFLESGVTGLRRAFHAPDACEEFRRFWGGELTGVDLDLIEQHREMTCRLVWKPYMHSLTLAALLPGVRTRTLVIYGAEDLIVPLDSGEQYRDAIPGAQFVTIDNCGHMPEMEAPERFADLAEEFFGN